MSAHAPLIVLSGIVVLALVEWGARVALRRSGYFVWPRFYRRDMPMDPEVSNELEPRVRFSINSDGERAPECPDRSDLYRVLMVGGSAVESAANDDPSTWPARVEAKLNASAALAALGARRVHVGNVGRSGLDMFNVRQVLEQTLPRYRKLDAIGLMVGAGDMLRWCEAGAPPVALPESLPLSSVFAEHPQQSFGLHPKRLAMVEVLRRVRMRWLRPADLRDRAPRWMIRARAMRRDALQVITEAPDATRLLARFEEHLEAAVRLAQVKARDVYLIQHPRFRKERYTPEEEALFWNGGVGNAHRGDNVTVFYSTAVMFEVMDAINERIRRVAARHGIPYIDPEPFVTMSARSFFDHFHLTPTGAQEVAAVVAAEMLNRR